MSETSRREFLKAGVAAAAVGLAAPWASGATQKRIKAGFLGVAHSHALAKWKLLSGSDDFEVVGLAENSPELRAEYGKLGAKFLSERELFDSAEAIVVESAVRDHARHGKAALAAGKHAHVEKPPAVTMVEMRELVDLARREKRFLQPGYMWRYHPGFAAIREAARAGWLGKIYLVRAMIDTSLARERRGEWAEFKGGGLFELGCHLIDPMVRLMGKPVAIRPTLRRHADLPDELKDNSAAVFEFANGLGVITNSTLQPNAFAHRGFEVWGSNGAAILKPIEPPILEVDLRDAAGPYRKGKQTVALPKYERYVGDFVEFAAVIRGEKQPLVTLEEELIVQEALLAACEME